MPDEGPEAVYLEHMPRWVARRLDELYGDVASGSVTVHKNDGKALKFETHAVETARESR